MYTQRTPETIRWRVSSLLPVISKPKPATPVAFPPDRVLLLTKPIVSGLPAWRKTMGMSPDAAVGLRRRSLAMHRAAERPFLTESLRISRTWGFSYSKSNESHYWEHYLFFTVSATKKLPTV